MGEEFFWVRNFSRDRRSKLQRWFTARAKREENAFDSSVFHELVEIFTEVETS